MELGVFDGTVWAKLEDRELVPRSVKEKLHRAVFLHCLDTQYLQFPYLVGADGGEGPRRGGGGGAQRASIIGYSGGFLLFIFYFSIAHTIERQRTLHVVYQESIGG